MYKTLFNNVDYIYFYDLHIYVCMNMYVLYVYSGRGSFKELKFRYFEITCMFVNLLVFSYEYVMLQIHL